MRNQPPPLLDIQALGGICGSISIACWLVVFLPQIFENWRRSSAAGLSRLFVAIWLLGDVCNVVGALRQHVLPTMLLLAVYYTLADVVLLGQCFYYEHASPEAALDKRGVRARDTAGGERNAHDEETPLLRQREEEEQQEENAQRPSSLGNDVDATHLSPAMPLHSEPALQAPAESSALRRTLFNLGALLVVCAAGVLGWWIISTKTTTMSASPRITTATRPPRPPIHGSHPRHNNITLDAWGQVFGYLCAALYLGSRVPQLLLNYRRRSTEGISMLFFLFACVGNATYVLSILLYEPICARERAAGSASLDYFTSAEEGRKGGTRSVCAEGQWADEYGQYMLMNLSWLLGSAGALLLDLAIFTQFWVYRKKEPISG